MINMAILNNMEEKRNIEVTFKQATEWYNSGNKTLRTLALIAYTEDELKLNLNYIYNKVLGKEYAGVQYVYFSTPTAETRKFNVLGDLAIIAKYFNGDWEKTIYNTGYFFGKTNLNLKGLPIINCYNGVDICEHKMGKFAGVVYFKNVENATKAINILGDRVNDLFT